MGKSKIEWTGSTWNPVRARNAETGKTGTWCQKISPGCANCYAETHNGRNLPHGSSGLPYSAQGGERAEISIDPKMLAEPLRRTKPETFFVCSMSDLFMERVTDEMIDRVLALIALTPQHTYQLLTKRPERMRAYMDTPDRAQRVVDMAFNGANLDAPRGSNLRLKIGDGLAERIAMDGEVPSWPLPNAWLGTSVEDRPRKSRIDVLRETPAALRFLSLEPLLEDLGELDLSGISLCIVGGESGHGARPMHPRWARSIRDQCVAAGVPFFFKQWGAWAPRGSVAIYREAGRDDARAEGISWLADGRICCRDFSVAEHRRRIRSGEASSSRPVEVDPEALADWHRAGEAAQRAIDSGDPSADSLIQHHVAMGYAWMYSVGKRAAGRLLDGREWSEMPEAPHAD